REPEREEVPGRGDPAGPDQGMAGSAPGGRGAMTTIVVRRPPRRAAPPFPHGEFPLQEPPALPESQGGQVSMLFMYLPMAAASGVMMLMFIQPGATGRVLTYIASGLMVVSMVAMGLAQLGRSVSERKLRLKGERRDYLRYLSQARRTVRQAIDA